MRWTWPRLAATAVGVFVVAGAVTAFATFPTTGVPAPAPVLPAAGAPIVPAGVAPPSTTAPVPVAAEAPDPTVTRQDRAAAPAAPAEGGPRDAPRPDVGNSSADDDGPGSDAPKKDKDKEKDKGPKDDGPGKGHGKDR